MGKKINGDEPRNVEELGKNHPVAGCVNGQPGSTRSVKKSREDVDHPVTRRGSRLVDQENGPSSSSSLRILRKTGNKRRRRGKMGNPIIVEDAEGEFSSVAVPLPLRHRSTEGPAVTSVSLGSFKFGERNGSRERRTARALVTSAECIKPEVRRIFEKCETSEDQRESAEVEKDEVSFPPATKKAVPTESLESGGVKNVAERRENGSETAEGASSAIGGGRREDTTGQLPRFYSIGNKVLAIMETDCKFSFHGKLRVSVLYGAVRIYGYTLNSTGVPLRVYSPRAYSPVAIEAIDTETTRGAVEDIWESLEEPGNDPKLADRLRSDVSLCEEGWAIVVLENFDNHLTKFLNGNCPFHLFPRVDDPSNHSWRDPRRAEIVLQSNLRFQDPYNQRISIDSRGIDDVADAITYDRENSRTVIAGGKGVGKSTMARYLVNKFLAKSEAVVFIDLDPGQAEFTPAGCISVSIVEEPLLGPNFTHLGTPHSQLYLGSADVTRCLVHYVDGVKKLVRLVNDDPRLSRRPLVVNTMGYCKGIGWDVIGYVIKIVSPTDVIQILSRRGRNNFDDTLSRRVIDSQNLGWITWRKETSDEPTRHRLHVIYSEAETGTGPAESWSLEAHQQRDLVMISYLSEIVRINEQTLPTTLTRGTSSLTINAVPPYVIPFAAMSVSLAGAFIRQVLSVMNGNIVALCGVDPESTEHADSEEISTGCYPRVLIRAPLSTCYGFGILRGVDMEREQLFLNTPLPPAHMRHVNCLVGSTNLPRSLLQLDQQGAPYTGSEYDLPTSRGPRRGYFRTRYQADT